MGAYIGPPTWYVRRAGDTMTGDLNFSAGSWVIGHAKIISGTYVGNGLDDRSINIGVDLTSKSNVYIIIKGIGSQGPAHRVEYAQGDLTMLYEGLTDLANIIQSVNATGFVIGSSNYANQDTFTFRYIVIYEEP